MSGPMEPMNNESSGNSGRGRQRYPRVTQTMPAGRQMYKDQSRVPSDYNAPRDRPQPPRARQTTSGTPSGFRMPGEVSEYSRQPTDPMHPGGQPTPIQFILKAIQQFDKGGMNSSKTPEAWDQLGRTRNSFMANETDGNLPPNMHPNYPMLPAPIDMPTDFKWADPTQPAAQAQVQQTQQMPQPSPAQQVETRFDDFDIPEME